MTGSEEFLTIDTPENVVFGYEVVGLGSRFIAAMIDTLLIIVLQIIVYLSLLLVVLVVDENLVGSRWVTAVIILIAFVFLWGYYIYFETSWNGQTPGKRWAGIRVLRQSGMPVTLGEVIIRNLIRIIDFLPVLYGLGIVVMFADRQSRRLGDLAAGTLVVRAAQSMTLDSLQKKQNASERYWQRQAQQTHIQAIVAQLPLHRLKAADLELVEDYLRRRDTLTAVSTLEQQLLTNLLIRMEADPLPPHVTNARDTSALLMAILQKVNSRS
ncbi:MAG: RDD family protein [Chloroflexota bacterium]